MDLEITKIIAKAIGFVIFIGALALKLPQIYNIISSKSVAGIVPISFYGDVLIYITSISYNILNNNPFSSYGEAVAIIVQNLILVILLWIYYIPRISFFEKLIVSSIFIIVFIVSISLPESLYPVLVLINLPLSIISRVPQIVSNYKAKSTGTISIITIFLNFAGACARVFTTIAEVGWDVYLLTSLFISSLLSGILLLQIIIYRNNNSYVSEKKSK